MLAVDWDTVATAAISALMVTVIVVGGLYIALRALAFEVLASPVVQAIGKGALAASRVATKINGGDWKTVAAQGGMKILGKLFGAEE